MTHSFDIQLASEIGIEKALIMKELSSISAYKENNKLDERSGRYWVYYSSEALAKKFPYMKPSSIRRWMVELENDGYIESGRISVDKRDRVKWYYVTTKYLCTDQNKQCNIDQNEQCNIKDTPHTKTTHTDSIDENFEKNPSNEDRFIEEVYKLQHTYKLQMLDDFVLYWCEKDKNGKMKWELQPTWQLKSRLAYWNNNSIKFSGIDYKVKKEAIKTPDYFNNIAEYNEYKKTINKK